MQARVGAFLDGIQIVYMKVDGNRLDPQESYVSPWLGTQTDGELQRLLSKGTPYIGVSGACQGEVVGLKLLKK
jgi:hypothetical protein